MRWSTAVRATPAKVTIITPTKTLSVWNVAPATVIRYPTPAVAAYSSPTTTPTSARPSDRRAPVNRKGTELGITTVRSNCMSFAPNERAHFRMLASTVVTPTRA